MTDELSTSDLPRFLTVFSLSFLFFWTAYFVSENIISKMSKTFQKLPSGQQALYLSNIVANIHAVIACTLSAISFLYSWYA